MNSPRKLLVLDIDETLVFATETPLERDADFVVGRYLVYKRPHLDRFLDYALRSFDVGVWTSSGDEYASGIIENLFPAEALQFVWSSDKCTIARDLETDVYYSVKNLDKLKAKGYALESIIVIDDTPRKHARNFGNLVAVSEYRGGQGDDELQLLMSYLDHLKDVPNVRTIEKRGWRRRVERRTVPQFTHRLALRSDLDALVNLMNAAIAELQKPFLTAEQIASSRAIMGVDTQLIDDGTYFVVEVDGEIVGSGGWSRRATLYGGDHSSGRDAALLDPALDAARVRAMYTHPDHARKGIGRLILSLCEDAARAEGFQRVELMATMAGEPLYRACGYEPIERIFDDRGGVAIPLLRMRKRL